MSYYNTTHLAGPTLFKFEDMTISQDDAVRQVFKAMRDPMTPSQAEIRLKQLQLIHPNTPLTSIRRSITTLTCEGVLRKTNIKVPGRYGREEYKWEYIKESFSS